ncbi:MAG: bifunctional phosphopantothenoylcysteine decarboxylase/phosphopantothenate--cysteine ligase CoaBC [Candidatus Sumerlaeaceae bacterium]
MELKGTRIILGVSAGIAAYKAADLCSMLVHAGCEVRVAMSRHAHHFVGPVTFEALTQHSVYSRVLNQPHSFEMEHISWSKWADLLLIAPASADLIARMAAGIADDPITTTYLAFTGPVVLAPAMNSAMLQHPATQQNLAILRQRGVEVLPTDSGPLACGDEGPGRLAEAEQIISFLREFNVKLEPRRSEAAVQQPVGPRDNSLEGKAVLITSGPTREYIDPVRFISNPSSGRMGAALAREAHRRGAQVHLVTGPVDAPHKPDCATIHDVTTAEQMLAAVKKLAAEMDIFIFAAAVGDFRAGKYVPQKIKRTGNSITLPLVENPDIAQSIGYTKKQDQLTIGFAAETDELESNARIKMERKKLDLIVANDISSDDVGFQSEQNEVTIFFRDGHSVHIPRQDKSAVARSIFDVIVQIQPGGTS